MARVDKQSVCDRELFSELTESPSLGNLNATGSSFQSSLNPRSPSNLYAIGTLLRAHWTPDRPTNCQWSGALLRAHWTQDRPTNCQWSGALFRARWTPDRWANCMRSRLSSEVFETPIHLMLLNMVSPYVDVVNPTFDLQINGEGIWRWREVSGRPKTLFELFQNRCITTWIPTRGIWLWTRGASICAKRTEISAQDPVHLKRQKEETAGKWDVD